MDVKAARRMEPFCQYAVAASAEALKDSGISMEQEDPYRVGVSVGSRNRKPAGDGERARQTAGKRA